MRLSARFRSLFPVSAASLGVVTTVCLYCMVVPMPLANGGEIVMSDDIILQMKPKPRTRGIASESTETSPGRVVLPAIQFEIDSARFTRTALTQVQELGKALKSDLLSPFMFAVQGHTDSTGSSPYNRGLSLRRARAVTRYLKGEMGVVGGRLIEVGLGESFPIGGIPATDARNRRVEITKLGGGAPAEDVRRNRRRALLIGIDKYRHVSPLKGPVNDAKDMANFITGRGGFRKSDVRLLLDEEATKKNILAVVKEWLVEGTNPGDEVFLFYSGHGFQQPDLDGDETDGLDETLVPADAFVNEDGKIKGMITDDELGVLVGSSVRPSRACSGRCLPFGHEYQKRWRLGKLEIRQDASPAGWFTDSNCTYAWSGGQGKVSAGIPFGVERSRFRHLDGRQVRPESPG